MGPNYIHLFSAPHSVTSYSYPEIDHVGSIYTVEIGKFHKPVISSPPALQITGHLTLLTHHFLYSGFYLFGF